jgi:hypothetical protein
MPIGPTPHDERPSDEKTNHPKKISEIRVNREQIRKPCVVMAE